MEACSGAHFWAREQSKLGHDARLILPSYVKPNVKRGKIDAADAETICEAVTRPNMRITPQACLRHDADQNGRAAISADDAPGAGFSGAPADVGQQCVVLKARLRRDAGPSGRVRVRDSQGRAEHRTALDSEFRRRTQAAVGGLLGRISCRPVTRRRGHPDARGQPRAAGGLKTGVATSAPPSRRPTAPRPLDAEPYPAGHAF